MRDFEIEGELKEFLLEGEKFIWTGKPNEKVIFLTSDPYFSLSFIFLGFAIFWCSAVVFGSAPNFFLLIGLFIIIIGLYVTLGRYLINKNRRSKSVYGITQERIILKTGNGNSPIKILSINFQSDLTFKSRNDKIGTIYFEPIEFESGLPFPGFNTPPMFETIDNVLEVYNLIFDLQKQNRIKK